ncbi:MAG: ABC transporter ATP-binding protein [Amaricoccus sp.]
MRAYGEAAFDGIPPVADGVPPAVEAEGLLRRFGDGSVVDGVSLQVRRGEVVCLLGPSGCGKSTTLRMIAGVERPDGGRVRLDGLEVSGPGRFLPPECRSVGLMFQDFGLFPHLDARGNVGFGLVGVRGPERLRRVSELLGKVGMGGRARRYPHELSGGEQQRVALARALATDPRAMLMDEPFSGLDGRLREGVREATLGLLRESGTAVLMVTHDPEEAMRVADRIALMRNGRVLQCGTPRELFERPADRGVAEFFSEVNVLAGVVRGGLVDTELGGFAAGGLPEGTPAEVVVRPEHVRLAAGPGGARATIERVRFIGRGDVVDLRTAGGLRLRAVLFEEPAVGAAGAFRVELLRSHVLVFGRRSEDTVGPASGEAGPRC